MLFLPIHKHDAPKKRLDNHDMTLDDAIKLRKADRKRRQQQQHQQQRSIKKIKVEHDPNMKNTEMPVKKKKKKKTKHHTHKRQGRQHLPPRPCTLSAALMAAPAEVSVVIDVKEYLQDYLTEHFGASASPFVGLFDKVSQVEHIVGQRLAHKLRTLNNIRNRLIHGMKTFERFGTTRRHYVTLFENVCRGLEETIERSTVPSRSRRCRRRRRS